MKDDWHFILQSRGATKIEDTEEGNRRERFKEEEMEEAILSASICCCRALTGVCVCVSGGVVGCETGDA